MMQPKRTKYRKQFKGNCGGSAHRGIALAPLLPSMLPSVSPSATPSTGR